MHPLFSGCVQFVNCILFWHSNWFVLTVIISTFENINDWIVRMQRENMLCMVLLPKLRRAILYCHKYVVILLMLCLVLVLLWLCLERRETKFILKIINVENNERFFEWIFATAIYIAFAYSWIICTFLSNDKEKCEPLEYTRTLHFDVSLSLCYNGNDLTFAIWKFILQRFNRISDQRI